MKETISCSYPGCTIPASKTWANVPLCIGHHDTIQTETLLYYKRGESRKQTPGIEKGKRLHYSKIAYLTLWKRKEGVICDSVE
jgi:hypothetical protein